MKGLTAMVCCAGLLLMGCGAKTPVSPVPITETPRVACVGDSITQGFGGNSYVDVLNARGELYCENFGVWHNRPCKRCVELYRHPSLRR